MTAPRAYTTPRLAQAQATNLASAPFGLGALARHIRAVVANPAASSDTLLITADALRLAAMDPTDKPMAHRETLRAWADTLADLAPTRADPIQDAA
jgi:hypothetical protein